MNDTIMKCPACGTKNRIPLAKQHLTAKCGRCGKALASSSAAGTVVNLDDRNFAGIVEQSSLPVLVDFYSPTCGPCQMLAPVIEEIARAHAGQVVVCKLDTSRHQALAARFQIRGVPTLLFFKKGQLVDQVVGAVSRDELERRLRSL